MQCQLCRTATREIHPWGWEEEIMIKNVKRSRYICKDCLDKAYGAVRPGTYAITGDWPKKRFLYEKDWGQLTRTRKKQNSKLNKISKKAESNRKGKYKKK